MNVELDRDDLISLLKGTPPSYSIIEELIAHGRYSDLLGWIWNDLSDYTDEQIYALYLKCKNSHES